MIQEWMELYAPKTNEEAHQALREIMQEVALAGLYRSGFFQHAAFYGGTALRIIHQLDRFSEDLDFSLLKKNDTFSMQPFLQGVVSEFDALGMKVTVEEKIKTRPSNVDSAFLKTNTLWTELQLENILPEGLRFDKVSIKIKIEVDTTPPPGFVTEEKLLLKPFSFYVRCYVLSDLFAGKMHALLFRKWKQRVKGRDWYDMEWYIKKGVHMNLSHFAQRAIDSGDIADKELSKADFMNLLKERIDSVSINAVKEDAGRFISDEGKMALWSKQYFMDLVEHMKF